MDYLIVCTVALLASGLTFFSGFGLGTLLLPAFALFFPVNIAVTLTAMVHLLNNIFKFIFVGKYADKAVVLRFGLPAIPAAVVGAQILYWLTGLEIIASFHFLNREFNILPVNLVIAILLIVFALVELLPILKNNLSFERKHLPLGGILSGFFGGLSGHQGALRSAFLIKYGLSKESFIGTGVAIAILVDISRLFSYGTYFAPAVIESGSLLAAAVLTAFIGSFIGSRLLPKVKLRTVQIVVSVMLLGIAFGLAGGFL